MKKTNKNQNKSEVKHASHASLHEKKDKVLAIASLVCGLLFWIPLFNFVLGPLAVVFGIVAIKRVNANPERYGGQTMAIIGIILGSITVIFTIIYIYALLFNPTLLITVGGNTTLAGTSGTLLK